MTKLGKEKSQRRINSLFAFLGKFPRLQKSHVR